LSTNRWRLKQRSVFTVAISRSREQFVAFLKPDEVSIQPASVGRPFSLIDVEIPLQRRKTGVLLSLSWPAQEPLAIPQPSSGLRQELTRCAAYIDDKQFDFAIADCNRAIEFDPTAGAYVHRGNAFYARGDNDQAIADYDRAIGLNPKEAAAYSNRGRAFYAKGENDRAIADFTQAIQIDRGPSVQQPGRRVFGERRLRTRDG
jgi:tetratricopeptide (TPR) repeat protein